MQNVWLRYVYGGSSGPRFTYFKKVADTTEGLCVKLKENVPRAG